MHCGYPHPELLWAVLTVRQKREIEVYAGLEPIGWDVGVSRPPEAAQPNEAPDLFDRCRRLLGA